MHPYTLHGDLLRVCESEIGFKQPRASRGWVLGVESNREQYVV